MTAPLYEIAAAYRELAALAEDGADCDAALAELTDSLEAKAANIGAVLRNFKAEAAACKAEEERLAARRKARESAYERLLEYVQRNMEAAGIKRLQGTTFTFVLTAHASVRVDDLDAVPDAFKRTKTETSADKKAILDAYKRDGECVAGATVVTNNVLTVK